ncbi:MAG: NAD-dependent epimerase/dehydratase family protein [Bacteroidota bacterium]
MRVIITGTTGMVGKGVLLECLDSPDVEAVLVVNRRSVEITHPKLKEILHKDFLDLSSIKDQLAGYDACFFCLGMSAAGASNETYYRITHDLTIHWAETLLALNPEMTFNYVSGEGTSTEENSRSNWANVKGKTENEILAMPFKQKYMFRPGAIQPLRGIRSATPMYNFFITLFKPLFPLMKWMFPNSITDTTRIGHAMINSHKLGFAKPHLTPKDINDLATQ